MKIKKIIKVAVIKMYQFYRNTSSKYSILLYKIGGKKPWSRGYFEYKWRTIAEVLNTPDILKRFSENKKLTNGYGLGLDERIVEYPWLIAHLSPERTQLLDAGSILNFPQVISHPKIREKNICIVTLEPESNCFSGRGVSYLFADMRNLLFKDNHFDEIACISTLEHVGMDNTMIYSGNKNFQENKGDFLTAISKLRRVLKPGGRLFLTVPFGVYENHRFFQQFNGSMLDRLVSAFKPAKSKTDFYRYSKIGWQLSTREECSGEKYFDIHESKTIDEDGAAAARAIACLVLIK